MLTPFDIRAMSDEDLAEIAKDLYLLEELWDAGVAEWEGYDVALGNAAWVVGP